MGATQYPMTEAAESRTYKLSRRLSVEFTAGPGGFVCEWSPDLPDTLWPGEMKRYRAARDEMIARLSERHGMRVLLAEFDCKDGALSLETKGFAGGKPMSGER